MLQFVDPFAASSTGFVQRRKLVRLPRLVRKAHLWCFDFPRTRATEMRTRCTLPAAVIPFAPLQPLSREVPEKWSLRRPVLRFRAKRVTGAVLSLQLPPVPPAVGRPPPPGIVRSHSVGPRVCVETKVPGSLPAALSASSSVVLGSSFT